jgi:release factor glutamine methyltransferase
VAWLDGVERVRLCRLDVYRGGEPHFHVRPGAPFDGRHSLGGRSRIFAKGAPLSTSHPDTLFTTTVATLRAAGCVFAEDEARLLTEAAGSPAELDDMVTRRAAGVPLEHLLGWVEFCGLRVAVDPGVFVPRRRTELLAWQAIALARPGAVLVDLCCGCGAVAAAAAGVVSRVELHAADIEPAAVRCARRNVPSGHVYEGDLYDPLPASLQGRVDVLVANAPYVPTDAIDLMPPEARLHEPRVALDGGADGLDVLRRVAADAPTWLAPGGHLLIETSEAQAPALLDAVGAAGLEPRLARDRKIGATIVIARR